MKRPGMVRDYILKVHEETLRRIRTRLSCSDPFEGEAIQLLNDNYMGNLAALTDMTLLMLGHDSGDPQDPRFDKTRRAASKLVGKRHGDIDAA